MRRKHSFLQKDNELATMKSTQKRYYPFLYDFTFKECNTQDQPDYTYLCMIFSESVHENHVSEYGHAQSSNYIESNKEYGIKLIGTKTQIVYEKVNIDGIFHTINEALLMKLLHENFQLVDLQLKLDRRCSIAVISYGDSQVTIPSIEKAFPHFHVSSLFDWSNLPKVKLGEKIEWE